jgi:TolB protein
MMIAEPATATFPGVNGQITFARVDPSTAEFQVWVANPDGSSQLLLSTLLSEHANWSASGNRIAFDFFDGQTWQIATINPDGSSFGQITTDESAFHGEPGWSPDGIHLVFESDGGNYPAGEGLYVMDLTTLATLRITANTSGGVDELPQWSPDGQWIAFARSTSNTDHSRVTRSIFLVRPDGSELQQLTPGGLFSRNPSWSPNGSEVVFNSGAGIAAPASIYVINRDGSGLRAIIRGVDHQDFIYPRFSPDGTRLLFSHSVDFRNQPYNLWEANADGSNMTQVTALGQNVRFADWGIHPLQ